MLGLLGLLEVQLRLLFGLLHLLLRQLLLELGFVVVVGYDVDKPLSPNGFRVVLRGVE